MTLWIYTAIGGVALSVVVGFTAYNHGKKIERSEWQTANVETLARANDGLADYIEQKDKQIAEARALDIDTSNRIDRVETRIIEKIKEIPVERVIKIDSDCRIDYGIVRLRNNWAEGDRISETAQRDKTGYIPFLGAQEVP